MKIPTIRSISLLERGPLVKKSMDCKSLVKKITKIIIINKAKRHWKGLSHMPIFDTRLCHFYNVLDRWKRCKKKKKLPVLSIRSHHQTFLYTEPVLIRRDFEKSFKVQVGWGTLLVRKPASREQSIEHISRKSLSPETRYLMIEKRMSRHQMGFRQFKVLKYFPGEKFCVRDRS